MARMPNVMGGSQRALWVTEELPDRGLGGGSIRQAHLFEALAARVPTDLLMVGELDDPGVRRGAATISELPRRRAFWSDQPLVRRALALGITAASAYPAAIYPARPNRRALASALRGTGTRYGVVCVEHEALAPLASSLPGAASVLTFHHLVSGMVEQELGRTTGARQRWFLERDRTKARRLERTAMRRFDRVIVCSAEDGAALAKIGDRHDADKLTVIPNGVDLATHRATPVPSHPTVLFPGSLNYAPNVDGAVWFCGEVWPQVRREVPNARLIIAGRMPVAQVIALGELPGVAVKPDVPSMADCFRAARVVVVPLRVGTGTRLKALEAMAAGRPLVGTRVGLEGIGLSDGIHGRVTDDPDTMAAAVVAALTDDALASRLGRAARDHVQDGFGWDTIGVRFAETVTELITAGGYPTTAHGVAGPR